jgi:hypothetical protein
MRMQAAMQATTSALDTVARAAFMLLAALLPFELIAPITRLGPLVLTSVELALYAALGAGAAAIAVGALARPGGPGLRGPLRGPLLGPLRGLRLTARDAAVGVLAVVLLVSAARAPLLRATAFKFALRSIGGMALFFVAARVLRRRGAALAVAACLTGGALVAALLIFWDRRSPGAAAALAPFHGSFDVFGLPRASGPFQYPNIAAMYLEAALPVALAVGAAIDVRRGGGPGFAIAGMVAALLLGRGVSLTESRAGVITVGVVLAGMTFFAGRARPTLRRQSAGVLVGLVLLAVAGSLSSLSTLRLKFWQDEVWYKSAIGPAPDGPGLPTTLAPEELAAVAIEIRNLGARPWPAAGAQPVMVSYHWRDVATGRTVVFDGVRTPLPNDVPHDATARVAARVRAPSRPGRYQLQFDLVHEGVTWFSERGDPGYQLAADVVETGDRPRRRAVDTLRFEAEADAAAATAAAAAAAASEISRPRLWRGAFAAFQEHPLLGLGPDNFRHAHGRYIGLPDNAVVDDRLHANSWFFETLATLGLCGVAALAGVVVLIGRTGRRALIRHGRSSPEGLLAFGLSAALAAYLIHGLFDYFLEFTPTYGLLWLLAGMLAALADGPEYEGPEHNRLRAEQDRVRDDELRSSSLVAGGAGPSQGPEYE